MAAHNGDSRVAAAAAPAPGTKVIREGQASIHFSQGNEVFYNKVQEYNRDLSIQVIKLFVEHRLKEKAERALKKTKRSAGAEVTEQDLAALGATDWGARAGETAATDGVVILDALAATALRSIRYIKEIPGVKRVVVNDLDPAAVEAAKRNMEQNQVDPEKVTVQQGDACMVMYAQSRNTAEHFDVVDIDPYGSASPFLDSAVQAVADGGLLCVTCTDMAVLTGNHAETCFAKYGGMPTKGRYMREMAIRILLHALEAQANRYKRHIKPLLSIGADFYVRVFVRVHVSPAEVKKSCRKAGYVYQSMGCGTFFVQPLARQSGGGGDASNGAQLQAPRECPQTGSRMRIGGPMWTDPVHDMAFVAQLLARAEKGCGGPFEPGTRPRIHGVLTAVSEELPDVPLHYCLPDLCSTLHCSSPKMTDVQFALINAGYRVSQQHQYPNAIKTDAPNEVLWDIMRCWVKRHPVNSKRNDANSPGHKILSQEPELQADFKPPSTIRSKKPAIRYQQNPEPFWGPKSRARGNKRTRDEAGATPPGEQTGVEPLAEEETSKKPCL